MFIKHFLFKQCRKRAKIGDGVAGTGGADIMEWSGDMALC